jgi:tetratricopeptide (TPR) repeat protein
MTEKSVEPLELFYSYAHKDEALRKELENHLSLLKRQGYIKNWHNRMVTPGNEWAREINAHLVSARIILLLVSPDFMASDYCYDIEVQQALEKHKAGEACVIPVIIRPVDWEEAPFGELQALPANKKPVVSWHGRGGRDKAFQEIAKGIRDVVRQGITVKKSSAQSDILQKTKKQWLDEGNDYYNAKRYKEAFAAFKQAAILDRNDSYAYCNGGIALFQLGVYSRSIDLFDSAIRIDPNNAYIHYNKGIALYNLQHYDEAMAAFDKALQLNPSYTDAYEQREQIFREIIEQKVAATFLTIEGKYQSFTEEATKVLLYAEEEARHFRHPYIGTEHLLLGLLHGAGIATHILSYFEADLKKIRNATIRLIGQGNNFVDGDIGLTPRTKKVIDLAIDEAHRLAHHYLGDEHLLLGLLREREGIGASVLREEFHITLDATRMQVNWILSLGLNNESSKNKFNKLNEEIKDILLLAQQDAFAYEHNYIGTEHFLLGFTYQDEGKATLILSALGIEPDVLHRAIEKYIRPGHQMRGSNMDFTPQAIKAVQSAFDEAAHLGDEYVGTEHLLMGMLRDIEAIATSVLNGLGVTLKDARSIAIELSE